ncbi:MAG: sugar phosphate isomerase/epimerase [Dehalococcoidia bacterium]
MTILALSTMWAQQERFADMGEFVRAVHRLGYDAIEISHLTPTEPFQQLLGHRDAFFTSIHAPAPLSHDGRGRANSALNLASLDEEERRAAIDHTRRSIDHAARTGIHFVVVHLGSVGSAMLDSERRLRRRFDSGVREGAEVEALRAETLRRRAQQAPPYLENARRTLEELAAHASLQGVALGIENRYHLHEIPLLEETPDLLAEHPADVVGYWHDVGHAEVLHRLGLADARAWLPALRDRTLGVHLHDVDGIGDHRAPGRGDVEWEHIARGLPADALRVFEIDQGQPDEAVAGAIEFLHARGVVP